MLAWLAAACAVFGLAGAAAATWWPSLPFVARGLFLLALIAGAWDAAIDTWHNLRKGEVEIHFLMLTVALGAEMLVVGGLAPDRDSAAERLERALASGRAAEGFGHDRVRDVTTRGVDAGTERGIGAVDAALGLREKGLSSAVVVALGFSAAPVMAQDKAAEPAKAEAPAAAAAAPAATATATPTPAPTPARSTAPRSSASSTAIPCSRRAATRSPRTSTSSTTAPCRAPAATR